MLGIILLAVFAIVGLAIMIALVRALVQLLLKLTLALAVSLLIAGSVGVVSAVLGHDGVLSGVLAWILALPLALVIVWRWRGFFDDDRKPAKPPVIVKPTNDVEEMAGVSQSKPLADAWNRAELLAPNAGLHLARMACAHFLAVHESVPQPEPAAMDLALLIRRHVPGLVADVERVWAQATAVERQATVAEMVSDLHQIGDDAEAMLAELRQASRDQLKIRRARIAMAKTFERDRK